MAEGTTTKKFNMKELAKGMVADVKSSKTSTKVAVGITTVAVGLIGGVVGHAIPKKEKKAKK